MKGRQRRAPPVLGREGREGGKEEGRGVNSLFVCVFGLGKISSCLALPVFFSRSGRRGGNHSFPRNVPVLFPPIFAMDEARITLASCGGRRWGGPERRRRRVGASARARARGPKKEDIVVGGWCVLVGEDWEDGKEDKEDGGGAGGLFTGEEANVEEDDKGEGTQAQVLACRHCCCWWWCGGTEAEDEVKDQQQGGAWPARLCWCCLERARLLAVFSCAASCVGSCVLLWVCVGG